MIVISVLSHKGGATKTTTALHLAMAGVAEGLRVAVIDADFSTLSKWHHLRRSPVNPALISCRQNLKADLAGLRRQKFDVVVIDGPPKGVHLVEALARESDLVVIPLRASAADIMEIDTVADICKAHRVPFVFLIAAVDARYRRLTKEAADAAAEVGPVLSAHTTYKLAYIEAAKGDVAWEIDRSLVAENQALWTEVTKLAGKPKPKAKR